MVATLLFILNELAIGPLLFIGAFVLVFLVVYRHL